MNRAQELLLACDEMRTKEIKIEGEKVISTLIGGGPGFKIYSPADRDGWAVMVGKNVVYVGKDDPSFDVVSRYVNHRYYPADEREQIVAAFDAYVGGLK